MFNVFGYRITEKQLLISILLLGAILRFWGLGSAEIFHDEGLYAFRSIGYFDFIQNDEQSTPVQWFKNMALPWWTNLSFHDAPAGFFIIQKISFDFFGDSLFAARLPSALAGILAIWLIYLLAKKFLRNEYLGLLTAFLLAINHIHIWISRSSLIESLLITAVLLNIYCFFRFLEDKKRWVSFGLTLGLCFLIKYNGFFLIPIYAAYLLIYHRNFYKKWEIFASMGLMIVVFSPVIIYNFFLYKTVGHFDLQFAYLFGQNTPEWQVSFGKIQDPFSSILKNLTAMYSIPFLFLAITGIIYSFVNLVRNSRENLCLPASGRIIDPCKSRILFWWLNLFFVTLLLIAIGSAYRFISLYVFVAIFFVVYFLNFLLEKFRDFNFLKILIAVFLIYELIFTIEGIFLTFPDFGVKKLDQYLEGVFDNQRSALRPSLSNPHLDKIIQNYVNRRLSGGKQWMIIYDENVALSTRLWVFTRRLYYHGIPVNTTKQFLGLLRSQGIDAFKGYEIYFVKATDYTSLNEHLLIPDAADFENFLKIEQGLSPIEIIYGYDNLPMFVVYKFLL